MKIDYSEVWDMRESLGMGIFQCKEVVKKKQLTKALTQAKETEDFKLLCDIIEHLI